MIPQHIKDRIKEDAEAATRKFPSSLSGGGYDGYILGAEAEAERATPLVEALEKIKDITGGPVMPSHTLLDQLYKFAESTLATYNSKKG